MHDPQQNSTLYSVLQIHPAAPLDLVAGAYWHLAGQAHAARLIDESAEARLAELTHAYRVLADSARRQDYDRSVGIGPQSVVPQLQPSRRRSRLGRLLRGETGGGDQLDYYALLRVDPCASAGVILEAYPIIHGYYLRFVRLGQEPHELLDLLEVAYAVTSDPARRRRYDDERGAGSRETAAAMAPPDASSGRPSPSR